MKFVYKFNSSENDVITYLEELYEIKKNLYDENVKNEIFKKLMKNTMVVRDINNSDIDTVDTIVNDENKPLIEKLQELETFLKNKKYFKYLSYGDFLSDFLFNHSNNILFEYSKKNDELPISDQLKIPACTHMSLNYFLFKPVMTYKNNKTSFSELAPIYEKYNEILAGINFNDNYKTELIKNLADSLFKTETEIKNADGTPAFSENRNPISNTALLAINNKKTKIFNNDSDDLLECILNGEFLGLTDDNVFNGLILFAEYIYRFNEEEFENFTLLLQPKLKGDISYLNNILNDYKLKTGITPETMAGTDNSIPNDDIKLINYLNRIIIQLSSYMNKLTTYNTPNYSDYKFNQNIFKAYSFLRFLVESEYFKIDSVFKLKLCLFVDLMNQFFTQIVDEQGVSVCEDLNTPSYLAFKQKLDDFIDDCVLLFNNYYNLTTSVNNTNTFYSKNIELFR